MSLNGLEPMLRPEPAVTTYFWGKCVLVPLKPPHVWPGIHQPLHACRSQAHPLHPDKFPTLFVFQNPGY